MTRRKGAFAPFRRKSCQSSTPGELGACVTGSFETSIRNTLYLPFGAPLSTSFTASRKVPTVGAERSSAQRAPPVLVCPLSSICSSLVTTPNPITDGGVPVTEAVVANGEGSTNQP